MAYSRANFTFTFTLLLLMVGVISYMLRGLQLCGIVRRPLVNSNLLITHVVLKTSEAHVKSSNWNTINSAILVNQQGFVWSTVRVPRRAGPLAQAPTPQHAVVGADIDDDHHVRGRRSAALPRLHSDFGQRFLQISAVSVAGQWRLVRNQTVQHVQ